VENSKLVLASTVPCDASHLDSNATETRRQRLMPDPAVQTLADTFRMLGDPTRVRILDVLAAGELCVCDLAELVGISESAVSHQLRLLRGMRLVRPRRAGRQVYYSIDDQHIISLFQQGLRHVMEEQRAKTARPPEVRR
jgi:ArsR family transcriptional regulator, lead/cadmium/zinc/bismuth-responsive transcriptional repressor